MPPAAVVFDNDGLRLDTEPCWTLAREPILAPLSAPRLERELRS